MNMEKEIRIYRLQDTYTDEGRTVFGLEPTYSYELKKAAFDSTEEAERAVPVIAKEYSSVDTRHFVVLTVYKFD